MDVQVSSLTIDEAITAYLNSRRLRLADTTYEAYENHLGVFADYFRRRSLARLTPDDIVALALRLSDGTALERTRPSSPGSLRARMVPIRGFLNYAARRGWCKANLCAEVELPPREARRDFLRLTETELLEMIEAAEEPRDRAMLAHLVNTGCRAAELTRITLGAVDRDHGTIYTEVVKSRVSDQMPITADLGEELDLWLPRYREIVAGGPLQPSWYLYPRRRIKWGEGKEYVSVYTPEQPASYNTVRDVVRTGLRSVGYPEALLDREAVHTIRRSVARLYFDMLLGVGYSHAIREVQALLHHKSSITTERYIGLDHDRARRDATLKGRPFILGRAREARANDGRVINIGTAGGAEAKPA